MASSPRFKVYNPEGGVMDTYQRSRWRTDGHCVCGWWGKISDARIGAENEPLCPHCGASVKLSVVRIKPGDPKPNAAKARS